ncbi:MAG: MarR family transcriptional regulator, partial [Clostridiales bacterium]|nr:MarR family transcriptional regulator [Clostridiales bacterium]
MEQHKILREIMRNLERKMGMLDEFQVDCQNITCAQCHALVEIGRAKTLSLIHLSVILELDASTVSRTVERLVKAHLVNRNTDQSNRRYVTISLTAEGEKVFHEIETTMDSLHKRILQNIPKEKQAMVIDSIQI